MLTRFDKIDSGGFADVYEAVDEVLGRKVAVKIFRSRGSGYSDAIAHAKSLAKINHNNVVTVHRMDEVSDPETGETCPCVVMELIDGETLADTLIAEKLSSINHREADLGSREIFNGILEGTSSVEALAEIFETIPKRF